MPKTTIMLTLARLTGGTVVPHATYAERVLCGTPTECYEHAMDKLQQALKVVETQQLENVQLRKQIAELARNNQRLNQTVAQMQKHIAQLHIRFRDNGDGTVTDNRNGLTWLKNANCFGEQNWDQARQSASNLADGQCGLRDGSRRGQWGLPTKEHLLALLDYRYRKPTLSNAAGTGQWREGDAFTGVQSNYYHWSSSTYASHTGHAWYVYLHNGIVSYNDKTYTNYVWPVRYGR